MQPKLAHSIIKIRHTPPINYMLLSHTCNGGVGSGNWKLMNMLSYWSVPYAFWFTCCDTTAFRH